MATLSERSPCDDCIGIKLCRIRTTPIHCVLLNVDNINDVAGSQLQVPEGYRAVSRTIPLGVPFPLSDKEL
jgi:hypothetical protein